MGEKPICAVSPNETKKYIVFFTKSGLIKKSELSQYLSLKKSSVSAIKLKDSDSVVSIEVMDEEDVIVQTKNKMTIRFETKEIKAIGRLTMGVKAIALSEEDEVVLGRIVTYKDENVYTQGRGGKGMKLC